MAQIPHADPGLICPLHQKPVEDVCHKCPWWTQLRGKHPQTQEDIDKWACAISFLPMLLIENAQVSRGTGAAIESFRNEMAVAANQIIRAANTNNRMLPGQQ